MQFSTRSLSFSIQPYQPGIRPPVTKPNPEFLQDIGEEGMRALLQRFYTKLHQSPIKEIFPPTLKEMQEAGDTSADFFIQICGGPAYFNQKRGAPHMVNRHAPFTITPETRLHWLELFKEALQPIIEEKQSSDANIQSFWDYLNIFSLWMVNTQA
ncbi:globin [Sulfurovum sp. zt1-1]|uniref:Globin n=1 Tax=Sulfurovum zhangzhouensis TaxID=3019067 RepID=A0ABT7R0E6_9BACT|nr:globin [Sulfurovum zhangzhouensis]MDM5272513.1 globin [Sulfurovum zhangzhouensis]